MSSEIIIHPIGNAHSAAAIDLILSIQQQEFNLPVTIGDQPDLLDIDRYYHRTGGAFWGAFIEGRLIGTIGLMVIGPATGVIRKLFVEKDYRGKQHAIAQRLLDTLKTHCHSIPIRDVYLGTVATMKAAARFYERNEFKLLPGTQLPQSFPFALVDNTFYHLCLQDAPVSLPDVPETKNAIDQSGILAIATRLLRLTDRLRKDAGEIYRAAGIAFEPKWFPVIYVLDRKSPLTVMEIAGEIGYTHPSTISLLQQLEKEKLVRSARDKTDSRKRLVHLTPKCRDLIGRMKPVWQSMTIALTDLTNTPHPLLPALDEIERQLEKESLLERTRVLL